jgi:hypothetical protein
MNRAASMVSDGTPVSHNPRSRAIPPSTTTSVRKRKKVVFSSIDGIVDQKHRPMPKSRPER